MPFRDRRSSISSVRPDSQGRLGWLGSVPTYVQKAWRLEFAGGHGKKLIAKSIS